MIFSKHRKKIEPRRRFGSPSFRNQLKRAQNYKRVFPSVRSGFFTSKFFSLACAVLFIIAFYYLVISDRVLITEVALAGNQQVSIDQVKEVLITASNNRIFFIRKNHYFLMTHGRVNKLLTAALSEVKEVSKTNRKWPNRIEIEIKERNPGFVLESGGRRFLVDEDGVVVKEVPETKNLPYVLDQNAEDKVVVGEVLPNLKLVRFILSSYKIWPSKISTPIASVKISSKESFEAQFTTAEGWSAFFDANRSGLTQVSSLALVLKSQINPKDLSKLAYVDLRSEKSIYYCFKGTPCHAQPTQ